MSVCNAGDPGSIPALGWSPGEGNGSSLQCSCLEKSHGPRSLVGYCPWGCKELDTTEWFHFHFHFQWSPGGFLGGSVGKNLAANEGEAVLPLGQEDSWEKERANPLHLPGISQEEPCGLESMGLQRVRHNWLTKKLQQLAHGCLRSLEDTAMHQVSVVILLHICEVS